MDLEFLGKQRLSKVSFSSERQSYLSLQALTDPRLPYKQKASLFDIMDLEVSRSSQHRSNALMIEQRDAMLGIRPSQQSGQNYCYRPDIQEKDMNRNSNFRIIHDCICQVEEDRCHGVHCICFLTPREICVIGQCCPRCIQSKNNFFRQTRGWQPKSQKHTKQTYSQYGILMLIKQKNCKNMHYLKQFYSKDPDMKNLIFCTCKKSHCQKKYCLCFDRGLKCGKFCACIQCTNMDQSQFEQGQVEQQQSWQRYATYQNQNYSLGQVEDIDQFIQAQLQQYKGFNQTMQFQPVNFDNMPNHYQ